MRADNFLLFLFCIFFLIIYGKNHSLDSDNISEDRYILYDVNPSEGFNRRRDVYIRLAVWIKQMKSGPDNWHLVLPPWNHLHHWQSTDIGRQDHIPWKLFFNIPSLRKYTSVMEMYEFFERQKSKPIDYVVILQHYKDVWYEAFTWENKWSFEECLRPHNYVKVDENLFMGSSLGYDNITARNVKCVSFQGSSPALEDLITYLDGKTILIEHAEVVSHKYFGGPEYWKCRESMRFSFQLSALAKLYSNIAFNATFDPKRRNSRVFEDQYICVHLRRRDFVHAYPKEVPSIYWAAYQLEKELKVLDITTLFVATDAPMEEFEELRSKLNKYKVIKFIPNLEMRQVVKDGGIAIIDQIICSSATYFIGTHESAFSFRIQEEREILGFNPSTTFNRLCGDGEIECTQPTQWRKMK